MSYSLDTLLPCNEKLVGLWKANRGNPALKKQVLAELRLERQKLRVVLQFLLLKDRLRGTTSKAYAKRLGAIKHFIKEEFDEECGTSCCDREVIKTCDLTAEAAERYVLQGPKALKTWVAESLAKVKSHRKKWKKKCQAQPMTNVDWASPTEAYERLTDWAVAECLDLQKEDLLKLQ